MAPNVTSGPQIIVSGPEKWLADSNGADLAARAAAAKARLASPEFRPKVTERFVQLEARLDSFSGWPAAMPQRPDELARAGFYYTSKLELN